MSYCLDTGVLLHAFRNSSAFAKIDENLGLRSGGFKPLTSIVCQAELLGFPKRNNWGEKKERDLIRLFEEIVILPIQDDSVAVAYANLHFLSQANGINLGQNDLWLAATAKEFNLTILTFDADFDRASEFVKFIRFDQKDGSRVTDSLSLH